MFDIFLMVTLGGKARRSLRRPIASATSVTPKAAPGRDAQGDHQPHSRHSSRSHRDSWPVAARE